MSIQRRLGKKPGRRSTTARRGGRSGTPGARRGSRNPRSAGPHQGPEERPTVRKRRTGPPLALWLVTILLLLGVVSWVVIREVNRGTKERQQQEAFAEQLRGLMEEAARRSGDTNIHSDETDSSRDALSNAMAAMDILQRMEEAATDPDAPVTLTFWFDLPDAQAARRLSARLRGDGFKTGEPEPTGGGRELTADRPVLQGCGCPESPPGTPQGLGGGGGGQPPEPGGREALANLHGSGPRRPFSRLLESRLHTPWASSRSRHGPGSTPG